MGDGLLQHGHRLIRSPKKRQNHTRALQRRRSGLRRQLRALEVIKGVGVVAAFHFKPAAQQRQARVLGARQHGCVEQSRRVDKALFA